MTEFRCYFFNFKQIEYVEMLDGADDGEGMRKADALFASKAGKFSGFELWDRNRQVHVHAADRAQSDALSEHPMRPTGEVRSAK
jgi:hypothetical protein